MPGPFRLPPREADEVERVRALFSGQVVGVRERRQRFREERQEAGLPVPSRAAVLQGYVFDACDVRGSLRKFRERLERIG